MKQIVSSFVLACAAVTTSVGAQTIEFSQLGAASLGAPLPVASFGTSYVPLAPPYVLHTLARAWGYGTFTGKIVPSIAFGVDDNLGTQRICAGNTFPKHLGTDYAAPAGTPSMLLLMALLDGLVFSQMLMITMSSWSLGVPKNGQPSMVT